MRVISGKYKGKRLNSPTSDVVRPTGDKVKQTIFTKLQFFVADKRVLDLFCGSGALGIEALSKNAKEVVFVDKDITSVRLTQKNLKLVNENCKVLNLDYAKALNGFKQPFDLILIDPPYASGVYENCLELICKNNLLSKDGIIVCERDRTKPINSTCFERFDSKDYGTVSVDYFCTTTSHLD